MSDPKPEELVFKLLKSGLSDEEIRKQLIDYGISDQEVHLLMKKAKDMQSKGSKSKGGGLFGFFKKSKEAPAAVGETENPAPTQERSPTGTMMEKLQLDAEQELLQPATEPVQRSEIALVQKKAEQQPKTVFAGGKPPAKGGGHLRFLKKSGAEELKYRTKLKQARRLGVIKDAISRPSEPGLPKIFEAESPAQIERRKAEEAISILDEKSGETSAGEATSGEETQLEETKATSPSKIELSPREKALSLLQELAKGMPPFQEDTPAEQPKPLEKAAGVRTAGKLPSKAESAKQEKQSKQAKSRKTVVQTEEEMDPKTLKKLMDGVDKIEKIEAELSEIKSLLSTLRELNIKLIDIMGKKLR